MPASTTNKNERPVMDIKYPSSQFVKSDWKGPKIAAIDIGIDNGFERKKSITPKNPEVYPPTPSTAPYVR